MTHQFSSPTFSPEFGGVDEVSLQNAMKQSFKVIPGYLVFLLKQLRLYLRFWNLLAHYSFTGSLAWRIYNRAPFVYNLPYYHP